jgi:hypothetical protein
MLDPGEVLSLFVVHCRPDDRLFAPATWVGFHPPR